jgi:hypothetical protein
MIPERRKEISSRSQLEHIMGEIRNCPHQEENPGLDLSDTNLFGIDLMRLTAATAMRTTARRTGSPCSSATCGTRVSSPSGRRKA